ncbi:MAG: VanZ family protein [Bacteroidia bacterium]|nr:VanZ family protein [Bacteroidia bacterium]NNF30550.1 VanZ family protein [Flavobacteriaceae bacterium]MBT8277116.1 VanZ family protein [Bacteroidia bacterium]NNJ83118.1 VanZ family protein [Flavobacteriaceae bacterium]NNK53897.1 VanZ family protein [Flavobacteriaceae bacterium]
MMRVIKKLSGRRNLLLLGVIYTLIITFASLAPDRGVSTFDILFLDKYVHVVMHWLLTFIWLSYFFLGDQNHFSSKMVILALITCFFYGIVVEAFQHWFTETRTFDFFDIIANAIGDLLGLLSFMMIRKKMNYES